jgi:hypothetical protein
VRIPADKTPALRALQPSCVVIGNYVAQVLWEVLGTPVTYNIVGYLKWGEQEYFYDVDTNFTPFPLQVLSLDQMKPIF